jgi:hypothetical protein
MQPTAVFTPNPRIERIDIGNGTFCHVIDDALLEPERFVEWSAERSGAFRRVDFNAYPGDFLMLPAPVNEALQDFFVRHIRGLFDARRVLSMHSRLAMVTLPPQALRPYQGLCHTDRAGTEPGQSIQASVLYLFKDAALGGTSFYAPARPANEIAQVFADSASLSAAVFSQRYGIPAGYMHESNFYFTKTASVPARWNRLIFYDGSVLHSGDIVAPQKLSGDPRHGRLTLNGFFVCKRNAA